MMCVFCSVGGEEAAASRNFLGAHRWLEAGANLSLSCTVCRSHLPSVSKPGNRAGGDALRAQERMEFLVAAVYRRKEDKVPPSSF